MNVNAVEECRKRVVDYVMNFGKPVNDELIDWVDSNFQFDPHYETHTTMLSGHIIDRQYSRQGFIQRLKQAQASKQALSFNEFIDLPNKNSQDLCYQVQWRGDFTVNSYISSPHWVVTSFFDQNLKFILQVFEQQLNKPQVESSAPPISWKDTSQFKTK